MRIGQMAPYIVKHYFSRRREERNYGLLFLGAPGVGKSTAVEEAASAIAKRLGLELIKVLVKWSPKHKKFVINTECTHEIEEVLANAERYFIYSRFILSTVEPTDLSGIPRSREGITYYDPQRV